MSHFDTIVIGAGAAGFFAAINHAKLGNKVLLIDANEKLCEKIRISGGGRCNFTNVNANHESYISQNPHFAKSPLAQFTPEDFIKLVEKHSIKFHEKKLGQLFCDESSQEIINLLKNEAHVAGVEVKHPIKITKIHLRDQELTCDIANKTSTKLDFKIKRNFACEYKGNVIECDKLIIATGGLSIPQLGVSSFGYDFARLLGLNVIEPQPGLVPLDIENELINSNSGASFDVELSCNKQKFRENILFTHKGLSGPASLQISNYWQPGKEIKLNFCPDLDLKKHLSSLKEKKEAIKLSKIFAEIRQSKNIATFTNKIDREFIFSKNFLKNFDEIFPLEKNIQEYSNKDLGDLAQLVNAMSLKPKQYEGFNKAEVTKGGIDTKELHSKNLEAKKHPGIHFIGELVDVTGWLGGYNFQWAWSSAFASAGN